MSVIRVRAAEILGAAIEIAVPDLSGNVCALQDDSGHKRKFPSLAIVSVSHKITPEQSGEVWKSKGQMNAVLNVGRIDALYQLRLGAASEAQRTVLEDQVTALFFSQEGRPGVLVAELADCDDAIVGYELDQSEWRNETAFTDKWFSIITLNTVTPILVERSNIPTWNEIRMCLAAEVSVPFDEIDTSIAECVAIDENGNVTVSALPA